ncbi:MAG TPA: metallophosphoesterase family protein [Kofleriaceae bacterium]|nr:metallophosphoesterase family protein [Kofleriaceae bacterium]
MRRIAVVADTHSTPHEGTAKALAAIAPDAIFHAGDIGDLEVLERLREIAPLYAIRGNIDTRADALPDILVVDAPNNLRVMIVHIGVYGPKLRAEVASRARTERANLVVCGHSHVPFIGIDKGIYVFNPGSCGPRRFGLPIVLGRIDLAPTGVKLAHVDCETLAPWSP